MIITGIQVLKRFFLIEWNMYESIINDLQLTCSALKYESII